MCMSKWKWAGVRLKEDMIKSFLAIIWRTSLVIYVLAGTFYHWGFFIIWTHTHKILRRLSTHRKKSGRKSTTHYCEDSPHPHTILERHNEILRTCIKRAVSLRWTIRLYWNRGDNVPHTFQSDPDPAEADAACYFLCRALPWPGT